MCTNVKNLDHWFGNMMNRTEMFEKEVWRYDIALASEEEWLIEVQKL